MFYSDVDIKFGNDPRIASEFAYLSHVDCSTCFSENVKLTGKYQYNNKGFYVNVICVDCGCLSDVGDGEFLVEVASFDGENFHMLERGEQDED